MAASYVRPQTFSDPERTYAPFLKWAGGKRRLIPQFEVHFPSRANHYYEPFAGSAAVFFHLRGQGFADAYTLSDSNPELINVYKTVRDDYESLLDKLEDHHEKHHQLGKKHYYRIRKLDRNGHWHTMSEIERAARMLYLNRTCFNGLWRVNSKGQFNVPMGRYRKPNIVNKDRIENAHYALRGVTLRHGHFANVLDEAGEGDFVYFDPPYVPLSPTSSFTSYAKDGFGLAEQEELAALYRNLDRRGCKVMLSNSDMPVVRDLYEGFEIITVRARRAINVNGDGRGPVDEVVVLNY